MLGKMFMSSCTCIRTSKLRNITISHSDVPFTAVLTSSAGTIPYIHCRVAESAMLGECLTELAKKYPQSKFVKIISTECIPNYPDKNVPTVLIYKDTKCLQHLIGLAPFGGPRTTPEREYLQFCACIPLFLPRTTSMSVGCVCMHVECLSVKDDGNVLCPNPHLLQRWPYP